MSVKWELERQEAPPSPCIKVCVLDGEGYCVGCLRTGEEIGRWLSMDAMQQRALIAELNRRRAQRAQAAGVTSSVP